MISGFLQRTDREYTLYARSTPNMPIVDWAGSEEPSPAYEEGGADDAGPVLFVPFLGGFEAVD